MCPTLSSDEVSRIAEPAEVAAWADFFASAPGEVERDAGLGVAWSGGAMATLAWRFDVLAINRVIGLGVGSPATEPNLDTLLALYAENSPARWAVQVCPGAAPVAITEWLKRRGFRFLNNWARLYAHRSVVPDAKADPGIRIERVASRFAQRFGEICAEAFGWPELFAPWTAGLVGRPGWHHFMAFDGELPIGTGALLQRGDVGWLGMAATHSAHRRRGAQTALLLERMRVAREIGCEWLVVENAEDRPDRPVPSWRNLTRLGFTTSYLRPNWVRYRST
jgi:GNAT superfamily N-acetyltransferase